MYKKSPQALADQILNMLAMREEVLMRTFEELETVEPTLVKLLIEEQRDRTRAAHWAALPHRHFGSRSVYQVLADGEIDLLWDHLLGDQTQQADLSAAARAQPYNTNRSGVEMH